MGKDPLCNVMHMLLCKRSDERPAINRATDVAASCAPRRESSHEDFSLPLAVPERSAKQREKIKTCFGAPKCGCVFAFNVVAYDLAPFTCTAALRSFRCDPTGCIFRFRARCTDSSMCVEFVWSTEKADVELPK